MHIAIFEDGFRQHRCPIGHGQHRHELRLHVGREGRERRGRKGERAQFAVRGDSDAALIGIDLHPGLAQRDDDGVHVVFIGPGEIERAPGDGHGAGIAARLDPVGHHAIGRAMQPFAAMDHQPVGADAFDIGTHGDQQLAQIDDFRLTRGIVEDAGALGERGSHQRIFRRPHRHDREGEVTTRQAAIGHAGADIACGNFKDRAKGFERLEMKIDRPVADGAAARQRHPRFARTSEQGAKHQDRRAHLAHDVVRCLGRGDTARAHSEDAAEILGPCALDHGRDTQLVQQVAETVDVGEARQIAQRYRLVGQQGAGQQRQSRIFRAGNGKAAVQCVAAANINAVHRTGLIAANTRRARQAPCHLSPSGGRTAISG